MNGIKMKTKRMTYIEARKFVHSLTLRTWDEWRLYCKGELPNLPKRPAGLPSTPNQVYANSGWTGVHDWLGKKWRPYTKAKVFVKSLGLQTYEDWLSYLRGEMPDLPELPVDIPRTPKMVYAPGVWKGWGDWLRGQNTYKKRPYATYTRPAFRGRENYWSYTKARKFVHSLNLGTTTEWNRYVKGELKDRKPLPKKIPRCPQRFYARFGWIGFRDWIGGVRRLKSKRAPIQIANKYTKRNRSGRGTASEAEQAP
jgi:hypothetical protein